MNVALVLFRHPAIPVQEAMEVARIFKSTYQKSDAATQSCAQWGGPLV